MNNVSALGKETFGSPGSGQAPAGCLPRAGALNPTVSRALICGFPPVGRPVRVPASARDLMDQKEVSVKKKVQNDY